MRAALLIILGAAAAMTGCDRGHGLYSKHSPTPILVTSEAGGTPSFVGRWASNPADCRRAVWTLTPTELQDPAGVRCTFVKLSVASAGYGADVACNGVGPSQIGRLTLTLSGQGPSRGLTVAGGPFPMPVALTACPAPQ